MKTWKCPKCGHVEEAGAEVQRLASKAHAAGLQPEDLDDLVHELAASIAADANNGGVDEQIRYLVEMLGAQETEKQLDELMKGA